MIAMHEIVPYTLSIINFSINRAVNKAIGETYLLMDQHCPLHLKWIKIVVSLHHFVPLNLFLKYRKVVSVLLHFVQIDEVVRQVLLQFQLLGF